MTYHTENEAKTKWCPFARITNHHGTVSFNRFLKRNGEVVQDDATCIGSACMAWEWAEEEYHDALERFEERVEPAEAPRPKGYCGLAGKP